MRHQLKTFSLRRGWCVEDIPRADWLQMYADWVCEHPDRPGEPYIRESDDGDTGVREWRMSSDDWLIVRAK